MFLAYGIISTLLLKSTSLHFSADIVYFIMLLPKNTTFLLITWAKSITLFSLGRWEANVVTIIKLSLHSVSSITSLNNSLATFSLGVFISTLAYKESRISKRTFSFPNSLNLFKLGLLPRTG